MIVTPKNEKNELTAEQLFHDQVQVGLESAKAGRLVSLEKVKAEFKARRETTKRKLSASQSPAKQNQGSTLH